MEKEQVLEIFSRQEEIRFSKGYKVFEEVYESLKDTLGLKRQEIKQHGWIEVLITKGGK